MEPGMQGEPVSEKEPYPEPEVEPEPEPYPEPNPSPESSPQPDDDGPDIFVEPVPDWEPALREYGIAWQFHIYFMGAAFALLGVYSIVSIVRLRNKRLLSRGYFLALNASLAILGLDRAVYMFVDAYNHKEIFPAPVTYLLLGMGFPCLTSAFSILFLALLQSTKTQLVPPKIQKPSNLAAIITVHFVVSFVSDTLLGFTSNAYVLTLVCQVTFIIWGLFLSVSYMVIFRRLYRSTNRLHRESVRLSISRKSLVPHSQRAVAPRVQIPRNSWGSAIKLTLIVSFLGMATALLQLYGIIVVYRPDSEGPPEPWPWYAYQLTFRAVELAMCITMSYVATQPFRYTKEGREKDCTICCGICSRKVEVELDDQKYWKNYFEAAPAETFLPKGEYHAARGTQTSWKEGTDVNDASVYDSNSMKKLLRKEGRFKKLKKTSSIQDLYQSDPSKVKVTSASFSSFGMFFDPDSSQVIHNDLEPSQKQKNENMNANPVSPLLVMGEPNNTENLDLKLNASYKPMVNSETSV